MQDTVDKLPFPAFITDQRSKVVIWNLETEKMIFPFSSCDDEERYFLVNLKQKSRLFKNLWDQHDIQQKRVSFISITNDQNQINKFRIHSASHVDGIEDLHLCMYVPVS